MGERAYRGLRSDGGGLTADLFLEVVPNPTVGAAAGCDLLIWLWLLLLWGSEPTPGGDPMEAA